MKCGKCFGTLILMHECTSLLKKSIGGVLGIGIVVSYTIEQFDFLRLIALKSVDESQLQQRIVSVCLVCLDC